jgi:hypothetical protein
MRRLARAIGFVACLAAAFCAPPFEAQAEVLEQTANLRVRPAANSRIIDVLPAGAEVVVVRANRRWLLVSSGDLRGYVARSALASSRNGETEVFAAENPNCDQGYPYSGSSPYFSGLTELRHSEPLGALFGYHVYRPC